MSPDIREKAERLARNWFRGGHAGLADDISQALLEAHKAGREAERLLWAKSWEPARVYFERYCQDEAEDVEHCVCGEQQHEDAKAFATAIRSIT